jgi:hypothetical protein
MILIHVSGLKVLKTTIFATLHTSWGVVKTISHPFCEGGSGRKVGLPS